MRALLAVLMLSIAFMPACAFAAKKRKVIIEDLEIREERSVNAFNVFRQVCFANYKSKEARVKFAIENFTPVDETKRKETLAFVQSESGHVWTVTVSPVSTYTIVTEDNGNCHVIAQKTSDEKMHREMKNLVFNIKDSMTYSVVDYHGINPDSPIHTAQIDVKDPDGSIYFTVFTVTKEDKDTKSAEGVITMIPPQKK